MIILILWNSSINLVDRFKIPSQMTINLVDRFDPLAIHGLTVPTVFLGQYEQHDHSWENTKKITKS